MLFRPVCPAFSFVDVDTYDLERMGLHITAKQNIACRSNTYYRHTKIPILQVYNIHISDTCITFTNIKQLLSSVIMDSYR